MNLYTHAILSQKFQPRLSPADPAEYLWGAVAPDIRYVAGLPRIATHRSDEEIAGWQAQFTACASFLTGYRVHCLLDRVDIVQVVGCAFPLNLLARARRRPWSVQQIAVLLEMFFLRAYPGGVALQGAHNPVLDAFGIHPGQTARYMNALRMYLARPALETAMDCFTQMGILESGRGDAYLYAYQRMARNALLLRLMMAGVKRGLARMEAHVFDLMAGTITA